MANRFRVHGLKNRRVRFRIRDIHHPDPVSVLDDLHGDDEIKGTVLYESDNKQGDGLFVCVQSEQYNRVLIVRRDRVEFLPSE